MPKWGVMRKKGLTKGEVCGNIDKLSQNNMNCRARAGHLRKSLESVKNILTKRGRDDIIERLRRRACPKGAEIRKKRLKRKTSEGTGA